MRNTTDIKEAIKELRRAADALEREQLRHASPAQPFVDQLTGRGTVEKPTPDITSLKDYLREKTSGVAKADVGQEPSGSKNAARPYVDDILGAGR